MDEKEFQDFVNKDCDRVLKNHIKQLIRESECRQALMKAIEDGVEIKVIDNKDKI